MIRTTCVAVVAVFATGCLEVAPPDEDPAEVAVSTQEIDDDPDDPPEVEPPPVCQSMPGCSLSWQSGGYPEAWVQQIGCGGSYMYSYGRQIAGLFGVVGRFCPNTTTVRNTLRNHGYTAWYEPGYCSTCLNVPATKIFVPFIGMSGPGCTSGCQNN